VAEIVPGLVFAVVGELDGETVADGTVLTGEDAFHRLAGGETQAGQPGKDFGLDGLDRGHAAMAERFKWARRRSTMVSGVRPAA